MAGRKGHTAWINALLVLLLIAYAAVAGRYCSERERELKCSGFDIEVTDSAEIGFVSPDVVRGWFKDSMPHMIGKPLREIDVYEVERLIGAQDYISEVEAYTAIDGLLHVRIKQREPLLRIVSEAGHNFYVDSLLTVLPSESYWLAEVPVVSGRVPLKVPVGYYGALDEKKYDGDKELLHNLINFVDKVNSDDFLKALIVQIYFEGGAEKGGDARGGERQLEQIREGRRRESDARREEWGIADSGGREREETVKSAGSKSGDLLLLPRVGNQVIRFGEIGDDEAMKVMGALTVDQRLDKLKRFYQTSFSDGWWKKYDGGEVNVKFGEQVVVSGKK